MFTFPSGKGVPGRVATKSDPTLIFRLEDEAAGTTDRTAIGATKALEDAMRVAAVPRKRLVWVEIIFAEER